MKGIYKVGDIVVAIKDFSYQLLKGHIYIK